MMHLRRHRMKVFVSIKLKYHQKMSNLCRINKNEHQLEVSSDDSDKGDACKSQTRNSLLSCKMRDFFIHDPHRCDEFLESMDPYTRRYFYPLSQRNRQVPAIKGLKMMDHPTFIPISRIPAAPSLTYKQPKFDVTDSYSVRQEAIQKLLEHNITLSCLTDLCSEKKWSYLCELCGLNSRQLQIIQDIAEYKGFDRGCAHIDIQQQTEAARVQVLIV